MVTKRTGRPRGRPAGKRRSLLDDPDRYQVAAGLALQVLGHSQRKAFDLAATATPHCDTIEQSSIMLLPGKCRRRIAFELTARPRKNVAPTIPGRSSVLRQKAMRGDYSPDEAFWLRQMSKAIYLAMRGGKGTEPHILAYAYSVGEFEFARDRLLIPAPE